MRASLVAGGEAVVGARPGAGGTGGCGLEIRVEGASAVPDLDSKYQAADPPPSPGRALVRCVSRQVEDSLSHQPGWLEQMCSCSTTLLCLLLLLLQLVCYEQPGGGEVACKNTCLGATIS